MSPHVTGKRGRLVWSATHSAVLVLPWGCVLLLDEAEFVASFQPRVLRRGFANFTIVFFLSDAMKLTL
jgi:hypothetical protein